MNPLLKVILSGLALILAASVVIEVAHQTPAEKVRAERKARQAIVAENHGVRPGSEEASLIGECGYELELMLDGKVIRRWGNTSRVEIDDDGKGAVGLGTNGFGRMFFWDCEAQSLRNITGRGSVRIVPRKSVIGGTS